MRRRFALLLLGLALPACTEQLRLGRSELRHEDRADLLAARGDGPGAQRERWRATSRREEARLRATTKGGWFWSDVTLR